MLHYSFKCLLHYSAHKLLKSTFSGRNEAFLRFCNLISSNMTKFMKHELKICRYEQKLDKKGVKISIWSKVCEFDLLDFFLPLIRFLEDFVPF